MNGKKFVRNGAVIITISLFLVQIISGGNILQSVVNSNSPQNASSLSLANGLTNANISHILSLIPRNETEKNAEWNTIQYQMLLICPNDSQFIAASQQYAAWETLRGIPALVVANWSAYPGRDQPEQIRDAEIAYWHEYPIQWVLLMGDTSLIPQRLVWLPDTIIVPGSTEVGDQYFKPTDYYYADLEGNWNFYNTTIWGALHNTTYNPSMQDEIGWTPQVYVGRFPASNIDELNLLINKTENYVNGLDAGPWMNNFLGAGGILDFPTSADLNGEDEAEIVQMVANNFINGNMNSTSLLEYNAQLYAPLDNTPLWTPPSGSPNIFVLEPGEIQTVINNQGASIFLFGGHGNPTSFAASPTGPTVFQSSEVSSLTNYNEPMFVYADACLTNAFDLGGSIGQTMMLEPNTGAIGYVGAERISWYFPNDTYNQADGLPNPGMMDNRGLTYDFFQAMFQDGYYQMGKALYQSKINYVNSAFFQSLSPSWDWWCTEEKSITTYNLLGDPTVDIYTANPSTFQSLFNSSAMYEGSDLHLFAKDQTGAFVPNATLTIWSGNNKYHTFESDNNGYLDVDLPIGADSFNYTLWAHNMIPMNGSFTVQVDNTPPQFLNAPVLSPNQITVDTTPKINVCVYDNGSGVSDVWALLTQDNFATIEPFALCPNASNCTLYAYSLPKLPYGQFQYTIVAYDYAGNYNISLQSTPATSFTIPIPPEFYLLVFGNLGIMAVVIGVIVYRAKKFQPALYANLKELQ